MQLLRNQNLNLLLNLAPKPLAFYKLHSKGETLIILFVRFEKLLNISKKSYIWKKLFAYMQFSTQKITILLVEPGQKSIVL